MIYWFEFGKYLFVFNSRFYAHYTKKLSLKFFNLTTVSYPIRFVRLADSRLARSRGHERQNNWINYTYRNVLWDLIDFLRVSYVYHVITCGSWLPKRRWELGDVGISPITAVRRPSDFWIFIFFYTCETDN